MYNSNTRGVGCRQQQALNMQISWVWLGVLSHGIFACYACGVPRCRQRRPSAAAAVGLLRSKTKSRWSGSMASAQRAGTPHRRLRSCPVFSVHLRNPHARVHPTARQLNRPAEAGLGLCEPTAVTSDGQRGMAARYSLLFPVAIHVSLIQVKHNVSSACACALNFHTAI
jgi:hypothetical protein